MIDKLQKMQDQRGGLSTSTKTYGKIVQGIAEIMRNAPEWDSEKYHEVCNLVYQYGLERMHYGFWDGAIESYLEMIDDTLERLEAEQYAEAAAAAGQQDLLDGPDPDDPRAMFEAYGPAPVS